MMKIPKLQLTVSHSELTTNAAQFCETLDEALKAIPQHPGTDEEFDAAGKAARALKEVEKVIENAISGAVSTEIAVTLKHLEERGEKCRAIRLRLEKAVSSEKEKRRKAAVEAELDALDSIPGARERFTSEVYQATKGKRSPSTVREAARNQIAIRLAMIKANREQLEKAPKQPDAESLIFSEPSALEVELKRRAEVAELEEQKKSAEFRAQVAEKQRERAENPEPSTSEGIAAEWKSFEETIFEGFKAAREARNALLEPANRERAKQLAEGINAAWKKR